jgi:hypothetical protein
MPPIPRASAQVAVRLEDGSRCTARLQAQRGGHPREAAADDGDVNSAAMPARSELAVPAPQTALPASRVDASLPECACSNA